MDIFDFNSLQRTRYHVIAPEMFNDAVATPAFNAFLRGHYHKLNYTVKFVASTSSGYVDENGNYSGLVGMLQRREADMAMHLVLLGGLKDEPVKHDIVRTPADLYIYGSKGLVTNRDTDILDAKDRFDVTTLSYCYFMIHVVCAILALSLAVKSARWLWTRYRQALWKCFGLMVDQEEYRLKPWSSRLLWLHLSVAAFVAVFGYFLSLVSADSIAEIPPRTIDRYDDIFSAHFNKTVFHITTNGFYYDYLKQSPPGTKLGKLMRKLEAESNNCKEWYGCAIANVDPGGAQDFTTFAQRCSSGESALLFPRQGFEQGVAILGCRVIPDLIVGLHRSREMVATGSLTTFRRHGLDDQVERYIRYRMHRLVNMGVYLGIALEFVDRMADDSMGPRISSYDMCMEGYTERPHRAIKASLLSYGRTLHLCACLLALSTLSLILEQCSNISKVRRLLRRIKNIRKTTTVRKDFRVTLTRRPFRALETSRRSITRFTLSAEI